MTNTIEKKAQHNPNLHDFDVDYMYHIGLDTSMDLRSMFGDVKYVCMGGSAKRAEEFAAKAADQLGISLPEEGLQEIGKNERFSLYKVGPIISISHGMGMPSVSIMLHEVTKLLRYAGCKDYKFIRIGTSGGVGVNPGDVVITTEALNGKLEPVYEILELGESIKLPTQLNTALVKALSDSAEGIPVAVGKTISTDGFYEEQGRLDGALRPRYTEKNKMNYLHRAFSEGVRNIEMEASAIAAFCLEAHIPAAVVCAAILNRLHGDQVTSTPEQLAQFSDNAQQVVLNMIAKEIKNAA